MFKSFKIKILPLAICIVLGIFLYAAINGTHKPAVISVPTAAEITQADVPVIMYHSVSNVSSIWGDYVISENEFESDLKYLRNNGYTAVSVSEIVDFVNGDGTLPDKPIVITFDDGYYNNYLYVYPLLQKYEVKATISPIAYYSDLYTKSGEVSECYSHCTWSQLTEMGESEYVELSNHSYNSHVYNDLQHGIDQKSGENDDTYRNRIAEELNTAQKMIFDNTGIECRVIAYPFGAYNDNTTEVVKKMGFTAALTCTEGVNHFTKGDEEHLYHIKRYIRPHNKGLESILQ